MFESLESRQMFSVSVATAIDAPPPTHPAVTATTVTPLKTQRAALSELQVPKVVDASSPNLFLA